MSPQIVSSSLGALRNAGSVFGIVLSQGHEVVYRDAPFSATTIEELASTVDDIAYYFQQEGRFPDQLSFGYDGGSVLIVLHEDHRMLVFHHHADEVDFVGKAANAFLKDYGMNLLANGWAGEPQPAGMEAAPQFGGAVRQATQRVAVQASREG